MCALCGVTVSVAGLVLHMLGKTEGTFFPGGLFHMRFVSDSLRIISAANGSLCKWMQIGDKLI